MSARHSETRIRIPPDISRGLSRSEPPRPTLSISSQRALGIVGGITPEHLDREQHVRQRRPPGEEHGTLEGHPEVSERLRYQGSANLDLALGNGVRPAIIFNKVVFPHPEGPTSATKRPSFDREIDIRHRVDGDRRQRD